MEKRIVICDDVEGMRRYLVKMLGGWGYGVESFANPLLLLKAFEEGETLADLLLLDIRMPQLDGIEVLRRLKKLRPELPVIIMTGHGTIDSAVEAMKLGAYDYLTKPFPEERLETLVRHCLEREQLIEENLALKRELKERLAPGTIIFSGPAFAEIHELALRVADSDLSVLILGESGTGKELIAGLIHQHSPRSNSRFVAINCAALTETLLESQLFGHIKGAFTGALQARRGLLEEADGGTLFLDEVGDLSPALQAKLLRVLEEGEFIPVGATRAKQVDVRFLAATNKDLEAEVAAGRFRDDLFYRLNVISLSLPPLRERPEDITALASYFLEEIAQRTRKPTKRLSAETLDALHAYRWPGNVRELRNVIERCMILTRSDVISTELLPFRLTSPPATPTSSLMPEPTTLPTPVTPPVDNEDLSLRHNEQQLAIRALRRTNGNKSQAALLLGITRKTLDRKMKEFAINTADQGDD